MLELGRVDLGDEAADGVVIVEGARTPERVARPAPGSRCPR